ncbi:Purple acid phosphatase 22 [Diplonema papillatum]|nr:Purple acid phosphatase 22 [Diplonema papillatum]
MLTAVALAAFVALANAGQVHVALGFDDSTLAVAWTSTSASGTSEVQWGLQENSLTMAAKGDIRNFTQDVGRVWYTRTANMVGLMLNTKYYYRVGDSVNGFSDVFMVTNRRTNPPYNHILFGDMGSEAAFSICSACTKTSELCNATSCSGNTAAGLVSEVDTADMFLHVGDFAYNFADENGVKGDHFMENIEQLASRVPYMVSHGNHEDGAADLAHFVETFRSQPSNAVPPLVETTNGITTNTLYFSWDHALVHYISFSSELWYGVSSKSPVVNKETFITWLKADLEKANQNRHNFPWILIHDHRPMYSSANNDDGSDLNIRKDLEEIFFQYGIDMSINGHQHDYERSWPTYNNRSQTGDVSNYLNPNATVYIVTGAAGSPELHTPYNTAPPFWSAFRSNTFGYTRMIVHNASHIHWQQVMTDPIDFSSGEYGMVIDDWWMVQHNHGPFNLSNAPSEVPDCPPTVCKTIDHWEPLLQDLNDGSGRPMWMIIESFIKTHGERAYLQRLDNLMAKFNTKDNTLWEDGNMNKVEEQLYQWIHHSSQ